MNASTLAGPPTIHTMSHVAPTVFTWLDQVRARPSMWTTDSGSRLEQLETMVCGYYSALNQLGIVEPAPEMQMHFSSWLRLTRNDWSLSRGWAHAISKNSRNEEPWDVFFGLVDAYRVHAPRTLFRARISRKNVPTGKRCVIGMNGRMDRPDAVEIVRYIGTRLHFLRFRYGRRLVNDHILFDGDSRNRIHEATSVTFAKRWAADELLVTKDSWDRVS